MNATNVIFWHRRDLRIHDNAGLNKALKSGHKVIPFFIFDQNILSKLEAKDKRVSFIYNEIIRLKKEYQQYGSDLLVFYGNPEEIIPKKALELNCSKVYTNRDYEPYAIKRDKAIYNELIRNHVEFIGSKDHVIFEKNEVVKNDGTPYLVFTPYSKKWKELYNTQEKVGFDNHQLTQHLFSPQHKQELLEIESMGFTDESHNYPSKEPSDSQIKSYQYNRNFPSKKGTTQLGIHLRFGTISIRELANKSKDISDTFLNELIWRDFYQMILYHFPESSKKAIKKQYDQIEWEKDESHFKKWCEGMTGYPIVDAGMRELNNTGFMHNRVRMITASFLTKHLLIDWRWGEAYFASKLLDYEMASNVGGWQWASGSGCDAAPYFRIFNPYTQQQKFDKNFDYVRKWIPEFETDEYPRPIIEHKHARERALERYKKGLQQ